MALKWPDGTESLPEEEYALVEKLSTAAGD